MKYMLFWLLSVCNLFENIYKTFYPKISVSNDLQNDLKCILNTTFKKLNFGRIFFKASLKSLENSFANRFVSLFVISQCSSPGTPFLDNIILDNIEG